MVIHDQVKTIHSCLPMQKRLTVLAATYPLNFFSIQFWHGKCRKTLNRTFPTTMFLSLFLSHLVVIDKKE